MDIPLGPTQTAFTYPDDEKGRLERQHASCLKSSQLLFHPSLGDLSQFRSILDCTAGSLHWAADLLAGGNTLVKNQPVRLHPGCVVEACDVDPSVKHGAVPKGLSRVFHRQLQTPFPEEFIAKYDLINEHFLLAHIKRQDWVQALKDLKDILKPGGSLNLRDCSPRWHTTSPTPCLRKLEDLFVKVWEHCGYHTGLADDLPDLLREAGFVDVRAIITPWPWGAAGKHLGAEYVADTIKNFKILATHDGVALSTLSQCGAVPGLPTPEEVKHLTDGAYKEMEAVGGDTRTVLVVAKKPL